MIRIQSYKDRLTVGEDDAIIGTAKSFLGKQPDSVIFCHGSGGNAADTIQTMRFAWPIWARQKTVHVGDLGFQTWGNDVVVKRINQAYNLLRKQFGSEDKVGLIGASMGGCSALNFAMRYPRKVKCVALLIPLTDLQSIRDNAYLASRWPEIDAIYGAPPNQDYTDHSPITFVNKIDPKLPMKIWYSTNDPLVFPVTITNFLNARPQTEVQSMGAVSHDVPRIWFKEINDWVQSHM